MRRIQERRKECRPYARTSHPISDRPLGIAAKRIGCTSYDPYSSEPRCLGPVLQIDRTRSCSLDRFNPVEVAIVGIALRIAAGRETQFRNVLRQLFNRDQVFMQDSRPRSISGHVLPDRNYPDWRFLRGIHVPILDHSRVLLQWYGSTESTLGEVAQLDLSGV